MNQDKLNTINNKLAHGSSDFTQEKPKSTGLPSMSTAMAISAWPRLIKESEMSSNFLNYLSLNLSLSKPSMLPRPLSKPLLNMVMTMFLRPSSNI